MKFRRAGLQPVMIQCPFCEFLGKPGDVRFLAANRSATAFFDGYPVSEGHALIILNRHVSSVFELGGQEQADVWLWWLKRGAITPQGAGELIGKKNPPRNAAADFPGPDLLHAFGSV